MNRDVRLLAALAAVAAVALGLLAGCGGASAPKSTAAFCTRLADLRQGNPITDSMTDDQAAARATRILDDLIATAPESIKQDLKTFRGLIQDIRKVDRNDAADVQKAVSDLATPEVIQAGQSLADFAKSECGFTDMFQTGAVSADGDS